MVWLIQHHPQEQAMAVLHILFNFISLACLLCLPLLMVSLTYGSPTKSRFNKLTVFATGMMCVPLAAYMWLYRDTTTSTLTQFIDSTPAENNVSNPILADAEHIKFGDFFKLPIGPEGLEMTRRLVDLNGKKVRLVGYMVQQESAKPGFFLLTPLPAKTSEDDDSMADDLPPSTVFVHVDPLPGSAITYRPGLLELIGTLSIGPKEETDTRVSNVRLMLDSKTSHAIIAAN
jgi:hypothetical protein